MTTPRRTPLKRTTRRPPGERPRNPNPSAYVGSVTTTERTPTARAPKAAPKPKATVNRTVTKRISPKPATRATIRSMERPPVPKPKAPAPIKGSKTQRHR